MVAGELVEVPRGGGLGAQDAVEAVGGERGDHAVVEYARAVHDGGEFAAVQEVGQRLAVGGVSGGDLGVGAQLRQLGEQLLRARRVGS